MYRNTDEEEVKLVKDLDKENDQDELFSLKRG